jgi:hypothetical protein
LRWKWQLFTLYFNLLRLAGGFVLALTILSAVRRSDWEPA